MILRRKRKQPDRPEGRPRLDPPTGSPGPGGGEPKPKTWKMRSNMDEHERRRRRARKRRAAEMSQGVAGGNPLLAAVCRELDKHSFTAVSNSDGDAVHLDCWFFPPEDAHYRDEDGQPRVLVTINCSQPGHVYVAARNAFDVRDAVNKPAVADAVPRLEQLLADAGLAYHGGWGFVTPYVTVPNGDLAANPMLALGAIASLLKDAHQLAPVMDRLIRTGYASVDASTFTVPEWSPQEYEDHLAMLDRRGRNETREHTKRYDREVKRRLMRHSRRYGADPGLAKRVLGQIGHSPRVLNAQLFRNQVLAINARADHLAHPAMLQTLDRLLRQERRKA